MKYSWARDLPTSVSLKVIEEFKNDFTIVHIRRDDQTSFENTIPITDNFRSMAVLIDMSSKRLLIDSFGQHTAAALGLKSTVCWIANKPEIFGYQLHDNIISEPFTVKPDLRKSYLQKFNIGGDLNEFPYNNENEVFNINKIINSIKNNQ